jgi:cyclophilin family peptidyl-prolyl cis-trans isomerase
MKKNLVVGSALVLAVIGLGRCAPQKYPEGLYAEVQTNKGLIVLQLEFEKTPMTAANFVGLAEGTIANAAFAQGVPYFNGTTWHRVAPGHVIQCGIPKSDKAKDPGYQFPNEIVLPDLSHGRAGMVNMANDGPHTNASQWCITLGDRSYLDGDYTVFGHVVEGMDVVFKIVRGDEIQTVKIVRVGRAAKAFRPTTASFQKMVEEARARVSEADARRKAEEEALILKNWPNAAAGEGGLKFIVLRKGRGKAPAPGERTKVSYTGKCLLSGKAFVSTAPDGTPYWGDTAQPFVYEIGKTTINPGLDAALAAMKQGEKRLLIVPAEMGYKTNGFYAKERPNEKRFVISPNTLLVYEVERLE